MRGACAAHAYVPILGETALCRHENLCVDRSASLPTSGGRDGPSSTRASANEVGATPDLTDRGTGPRRCPDHVDASSKPEEHRRPSQLDLVVGVAEAVGAYRDCAEDLLAVVESCIGIEPVWIVRIALQYGGEFVVARVDKGVLQFLVDARLASVGACEQCDQNSNQGEAESGSNDAPSSRVNGRVLRSARPVDPPHDHTASRHSDSSTGRAGDDVGDVCAAEPDDGLQALYQHREPSEANERRRRSSSQPCPREAGRDEQRDVQEKLAAAEQIAVDQPIATRPSPRKDVARSERLRSALSCERQRETTRNRSQRTEPREWTVNESTPVEPPGSGRACREQDDDCDQRRSRRGRRDVATGVIGESVRPIWRWRAFMSVCCDGGEHDIQRRLDGRPWDTPKPLC
jgi:hypothetical protein